MPSQVNRMYMNSMPLVTVIIPCFNAEKYIHTTIESVLKQTYKNIEIIVIDDGSSDKTLDILKQYSIDGLLTLLTHPNNENKGVGFTRRLGINAARGEYLAFLDADDYFEPAKIEAQIELLDKNKDVVLCHTAINLIKDVETNHDFEGWFNYTDKISTYNLQDTDIYLKSNNISNSSVVIRADVIKQINFESKQLFQFEDWVTWTLASEYGQFIFTPQRLTNYRYHDASATSYTLNNRFKLLYSYLEYYLTLLSKTQNVITKEQCIDYVTGILNELYHEYANKMSSENSAVCPPFNPLTQLKHAVVERDQTIQEMHRQLAERDQQLAERGQQLAERDQQIAGQERQIAELNQHLAYRERIMHELLNSYSWKITAPIRRAADIALPIINKFRNDNIPAASSEVAKSDFAAYHVKPVHPIRQNRPKVVHALANFMTGGSSRLVIDLIEHLGHIYEQEVITSHSPTPPCYTGLVVHELTSPRRIIEYLQEYQPVILHVHYWGECDKVWYEQVFSAAENYGCKVIENVNTPVEPYFSDSIDSYVYVSNYVLNHYGKKDDNNAVIYPGSNLAIFSRRESLNNIPDNCIGMVYRLETDKLNEQSIDVFIKVAKLRPDIKVLIVGGGTYLETYKNAASAQGVLKSFTFTGYVSYEELPALYEQLSIFVAPVWKESFGQVSPFAMSMGIPVVGYDVGGLAEIVSDKSLLAFPGDSDRLAAIIIDLLDNPDKRSSIGKLNHDRAQKLFSVDAMVERYEELYMKLLESRS